MKNHCVILGIETSCDETAVALILDGRKVIDRTTRQVLHERYGGVVPELASRAHERLLAPAVRSLFDEYGNSIEDIDAVAVTHGPGLAGALLVGVSFAKGLAGALGADLIGVNHLEAHLWSSELTSGPLPLPFLALLISGGHTLLAKVTGFGKYTKLGGTRDDAVGELFDKTGRMLGFNFPAGEAIDSLALSFEGEVVKFPRAKLADDPMGFSFSGIKTAVLYHLMQNYERENLMSEFRLPEADRAAICCGLMQSVGDMLTGAVETALLKDSYRALVISGGVSASKFLRAKFELLSKQHNLPLFIPPVHHCTDNGSMIAHLGYQHFIRGNISQHNLQVEPSLSLFERSCLNSSRSVREDGIG